MVAVVTIKDWAKAVFLKTLPLCITAVACVAAARYFLMTYLSYKLNPLIYFLIGAGVCSWIIATYYSPISRALHEEDNDKRKNRQ